MIDNKILKRANELFEEIRTIRRDVHMHPELGYHENRTLALIKAKLREYGYSVLQMRLLALAMFSITVSSLYMSLSL